MLKIPVELKRKVNELWPTLYQVIKSFFGFLLFEVKGIVIDIYKEMTNRY